MQTRKSDAVPVDGTCYQKESLEKWDKLRSKGQLLPCLIYLM